MLTVSVDTRQFDKVFKEYMEHTKKDLTSVVNNKLFFICRGAVRETKSADSTGVKAGLMAASTKNSKAPLAAILVNKQRGKKGEIGLQGSKMKTEVNKFIGKRVRAINFLRSGWIPAIKKLAGVVDKTTGGQTVSKSALKQRGNPKDKGGVRIAPLEGSWKPTAEAWNSVFGGKNPSSKVQRIIQNGLQKAVNKEEASMLAYIEKKLSKSAQIANSKF